MALYFVMNGEVTDSDTTIQFVTIGDISSVFISPFELLSFDGRYNLTKGSNLSLR